MAVSDNVSDIIQVVSNAGPVRQDSPNVPETLTTTPNSGSTKQRNYVLNDVGALKKKMAQEKRAEDIIISKEAKNFSNVIIHMRASFFEFVKANFIHELEQSPSIVNIQNAEGVKANTESCGEAFVEYSVEITFISSDHSHTVKITAYTTTSQLMIQPVHEKPGILGYRNY